jgi:polyisoprenoid-binding protein YceI
MRTANLLALASLSIGFFPTLAQATTWDLDPSHTSIEFSVRHMMATTVKGQFEKVKGTLELDDKDITKSSVEVTIDAASIATDNDARDKHLNSPDFFDTAKFPTITFKSTSVKEPAKGKLEVTGNLTIKGVTKQVVIPITNAGTHAGMKPGTVLAGFIDGALKINRNDFNIKYGPGLLGDDVDITLDIEAGK